MSWRWFPLLLCWFAWSADPAGASELRFSLGADPKTFDPLHVSELPSEYIRYLTAGVLVRIDRATDRVEPELAETWRISSDGRAITFQLRPGLKFSDGSSLTADDVARTLRTVLDPEQACPKGDTLRSEKGDPDVRVASPLEISIRYPAARPDLDRLFDGLSVIPRRAVPMPKDKLPVSGGPFYVADYRPGESIRLARNPYYWKRPALDSIHIDIQPNHDIEVTRFLRGELHLINRLDPESFDRVARENPIAARNLGPSLDSEFLWFNQAPSPVVPEWKRTWFRSAAFRHAVSQAIQRDDIARIVFRGHAHSAAGPVSPANRFWFNSELKALPYDEAAALRGLASEGFRLSDGVLRDRAGHAVEFSIVTNAGNRAREAMAALIQDDLGRIGIRVNIVKLDFSSLIDRIAKTSGYEACLLGFANVATEPTEQMNLWLSSGAQHTWWPGQKSPATPWEARIDRLALAQASEPSRAARKKAFDEIQKIVVAEEPIIYLVNPDYLVAISPSVRDAKPVVASPQVLWNAASLWVR